MSTNKDGSYYFNLVSKFTLGGGFGAFGAAQLLTGNWGLALLGMGIAAIFANDTYKLYQEHNAEPSHKKTKKHKLEPDVSSDEENRHGKKKLHSKRNSDKSKKDISDKPTLNHLLDPDTQRAILRAKKQKHLSAPVSSRKVPDLDLSSGNLRSTYQKQKDKKQEEKKNEFTTYATFTPSIYVESPTSTEKPKTSPKRWSQKPTRDAMDSARLMTEEEVGNLADSALDSPTTPNPFNKPK